VTRAIIEAVERGRLTPRAAARLVLLRVGIEQVLVAHYARGLWRAVTRRLP
jgi:hypothetical protein